MGRADLLAPPPGHGAASAGRRALARLRTAEVHRVAEGARVDGVRRLVAMGAPSLDALAGIDERIEAALAVDHAAGPPPSASPRRRHRIDLTATEMHQRRRAPLAGGGRHDGSSRRSPVAEPLAAGPAAGHRAAHPPERSTALRSHLEMMPTPVSQRPPHLLQNAVDAARRRPIAMPDPAVAVRLADRLAAPTDRSRTRQRRATSDAAHSGSATADERAGAGTTPAVRSPGNPATGPHHATSGRSEARRFGHIAGELADGAISSHELDVPTRPVVGLAGLARHFEDRHVPARGRVPHDAAPADPPMPVTAPPTDASRVLPHRGAPAPADDEPRPGGGCRDDLPASELLVARRLADLIGDIVTAEARAHGIDLEGIHRP